MHDDKEIIDLFRQRDQEAVRKVSQVYGALCRRVIRGILTDRCDVEECLQDTWLALIFEPDVPVKFMDSLY